MGFSIAVDGPAGAGKSTIARAVAAQLGFIYVDTGAMYRALAYYFIKNHVKADNVLEIGEALPHIDVKIIYDNGEQQVLLNGENVTGVIRQEEIGNMASKISALGPVREKLLGLQRALAKEGNVIMDGRDIGTHVLPDAPLKIYLTASVDARAVRRHKELVQKGESKTLEEVREDIARRDHSDMTRAISPLKQAEDAVYLDTSDMDIPQVIQKIVSLYTEQSGKNNS